MTHFLPLKPSFKKTYCLQGFLVEAKLIKLLAPIEKDERSLMKLDAIFNVSTTFIYLMDYICGLVITEAKIVEMCFRLSGLILPSPYLET